LLRFWMTWPAQTASDVNVRQTDDRFLGVHMAIQTRDISFASDGRQLTGYFAAPEGAGPFPGIVVIHEIFGLNDNMRDISRRFADEGYVALAVDLFAGRNRAVCMARFMAANLFGPLEHGGVKDLKAALTFLTGQPGVDSARLGAIGFCMGGGFAIAWACTDPRLKVIAPFYGTNPKPLEAVARSCPVVGSYPDPDFTTEAGRKLDEILDTYDVPHDIKIYKGARHSFFNDRSPRTYNAEAAADAWARTLAFFSAHLTRK
jgi:carboxymethylenebutenolidase